MKILFISYCTEYEQGWGSKPDGVAFSKTKEAFEKYYKDLVERETYEIFWRYTEPVEVTMDDETYDKIVADMDAVGTEGIVNYGNGKLKELNLYKKI